MIAATIGRTFLKAYNEKYKKQMTAKQFFREEFVPLFYGGNKYMQWITNSPFVQGLSANPKGEYGVREKLKGENGKTMLFSSGSDAVKYCKKNVINRDDFLYCLLPKFLITKKAIDHLLSLSFVEIEDFRNVIIDPSFDLSSYCEQDEENYWKLSDIGIQTIQKKKHNSKEEVLEFFSESFVNTKGYFQQKDNKKISKKGIEFIKTLNKVERNKLLNDFLSKAQRAAKYNEYDGSIAIGFPASETEKFQVASGQVTDIDIRYKEEEIYFSWIGNGLGIGVAGGHTVYYNNEHVLLAIYDGWKIYRELLNDKVIDHYGKQVDYWNGQWICYRFDKNYAGDHDFAMLQKYISFEYDKSKTIKVQTVPWSKMLFKLSNGCTNNEIIGFVASYGKQNKTFGFYQFHLNSARTIRSYYRRLFGELALINDAKDFEVLYGQKFHKACQFGVIGMQALRPIDLYEDIEEDKINKIIFRTYKTWLLAMINKEETLEITGVIAKILHLYEEGSKGTDRRAIIEKLLNSNKREFLIYWDEIVKNTDKDTRNELKKISDIVYFMPKEDYGYFIVLLKLDYRYQEK